VHFRMHNTIFRYRISFGNFNKKIYLGRQNSTSEGNIKADCIEMGCDGGMVWAGLF
jgi:hypothetical protein